MNIIIITISIVTIFTGYNPANKGTNKLEDQKNQIDNSTSPPDTTPMVTGIGGIFFYSDNPKETKEWYAKNLEFDINEWGSCSFEFRNVNRPEEIGSLQWVPFKKGSEYFAPSKKEFMINYRVQNIEGLINKLKENGVTILDSIASYDFGKFIHIMDAEGNKIELWDPIDSVQTNMEDLKNQTNNSTSPVDTKPKVTGIGGIFFFSDNPQKMKEWYAKNLGLEINEWGSSFKSRNINKPEEINSLQWTPFKKGSKYFAPSKKEFMINYRIQNIEGLVNKLKGNGVTVLDSIVTYEYGKFAHIMDTEGNKIELWEPIEAN